MKSPAKRLADLAARLVGARSALDEVHDTDKELRAEHAELQAEYRHILSAPPPRVELSAKAKADVDAVSATRAAVHGPGLVNALAGYVDVQPDGHVRGLVGGDLFNAPVLAGALDGRTLAALVPELMKQELHEIILATEYVEGPPMAERPRLLAEKAAKIADVEEQHASLVDQAAELGVTIALLDEVRARRASAAHRAEFQERQARDLARRIRS